MKGVCNKPEGEKCPLYHSRWSEISELADVKNSID
jgi:hypothetical protein